MCTQVPRLIISLMKYEYATAISRSDLHRRVSHCWLTRLIGQSWSPELASYWSIHTCQQWGLLCNVTTQVLMLESVLVLFKSFPDAELAALVVSCLDFGSLPPLLAESMVARFYLVFVVFYVDEFSVVSWLLFAEDYFRFNFVGILLAIFRDETVTFKSKCLYRPRPLMRLNRL